MVPRGTGLLPERGNVQSPAADEFAAAYESECRPGGPYGALETDYRPHRDWGRRSPALQSACGLADTPLILAAASARAIPDG